MSGETQVANRMVVEAMEQAQADANYDQDVMGRAIISAVLQHYRGYRNLTDIKQELQYTIDNLDEDEFIITRGC